jgi:hypothetical protein
LQKLFKIYIFQQYSCYVFLIIMYLDGNIQNFSYYFASDCLTIFNLYFKMKLITILTFIIYFSFIFSIFAGFFLIMYHYKIKSKYFSENFKPHLHGFTSITV